MSIFKRKVIYSAYFKKSTLKAQKSAENRGEKHVNCIAGNAIFPDVRPLSAELIKEEEKRASDHSFSKKIVPRLVL